MSSTKCAAMKYVSSGGYSQQASCPDMLAVQQLQLYASGGSLTAASSQRSTYEKLQSAAAACCLLRISKAYGSAPNGLMQYNNSGGKNSGASRQSSSSQAGNKYSYYSRRNGSRQHRHAESGLNDSLSEHYERCLLCTRDPLYLPLQYALVDSGCYNSAASTEDSSAATTPLSTGRAYSPPSLVAPKAVRSEEDILDSPPKSFTDQETTSSLAGYKRQYGSAGQSLSSQTSSRASSIGSVASTTSSADVERDYKKLYEEEHRENERLRLRLKQAEDAAEELRRQQTTAKSQINGLAQSTGPLTDKDRRAMERKLAELEEEVKEMEQLRTLNQKLKEENGALIRVISKLSK